jgi:hypothetical protein
MSLVGWWQLEGNADNKAGSYPSYEVGSVQYSNAKIGQGYDNTGNNGTGIELIRDDPFTEFENRYSWSLWYKSTTTSGGSYERILSRDASEYPTITIDQSQSGNQDLTTYKAASAGAYQVNEWHHVVLTIDRGENESRIFVDGSLENTGGVGSLSSQTKPFVIGGNTEGDGDISGNHFVGKIDDVRLYDHILSKKEVQRLSQAKLLHFKLNESVNGIVDDASGQNNSGSVNSGVVSASDYKTGSGAFEFTSSNGVQVQNNPTVQATGDLTISFWAKPFNISSNRQNPIDKDYGDEYTMTMETDGSLSYYFNDSDSRYNNYQVSNMFQNDNEWVHVTAVRDNGNSVIWYRNGSEFATKSWNGGNPVAGSDDLYIGNGYTNPFDGIIDDVRLYASALSADEVRTIYENRASVDDRGNLHSHEISESPPEAGADAPLFAVGGTNVSGFVDNTDVVVNGSVVDTVDAGSTVGVSSSLGDVVDARPRPLFSGASDSGTPLSWAGQRFAWRNDRYGPIDVHVYAPFEDVTAELYKTSSSVSTPETTATISEGTYNTFSTSDDNNQWLIEADGLVVVYVNPDGDYRPLYPVSTEMFGVPSTGGHVVAIEDNTSVDVYYSDGGSTGFTLNRGEKGEIGSDSQFDGRSAHVRADKPISVESQVDSDGGEMTPFTPREGFADTFVLPQDAEFVAFTGFLEGATVTVYDSTDTQIDQKTVNGGSGANDPTKLRILGSNESYSLTAGKKFVCSEPQHAIYEVNANNDETMLFGSLQNSSSYPHSFDIEQTGTIDTSISEVGPAPDSLVGWWPLDGHLRDLSDSRKDGVNNGASVTSGLGQSSYDFERDNNDYVDVGVLDDSCAFGTGGFTFSAWVRFESINSSATIFELSRYTDSILIRPSGNNLQVYIDNGSDDRYFGPTIEANTGEWYHFVVTRQSDGSTVEVFENGASLGTNSGMNANMVINQESYIGMSVHNTGQAFDGEIQDVRLYDKSFSAAEVNQLYNITDPRRDQRVMQTSDGAVVSKEEFNELI